MASKTIMDNGNVGRFLRLTIGSFTQDRLINREERLQHKEQCAERLAASGSGEGDPELSQVVAYAEQAVLANLDWGIDALEEAISTSNTETKAARLEYAEKMLQVCALLDTRQRERQTTAGVPNSYLSAWAHLNLALLWKIKNNDINAVVHILDMFLADPLFSRIDFAPELWESLFLPHLGSIVGWYTEERHRVLSEVLPESTQASFHADEYDFNESLLSSSTLSPERAQRLKQLEKVYQGSLDENTRLYARYYKDWLNFDPCMSKKGIQPLMPIAEPPMTPRQELSRSIPQSVKFGPVPPRSAGFTSVYGISVGSGEASPMYASKSSRIIDDEPEALSGGNASKWQQGLWEEEEDGAINVNNDSAAYNGDLDVESEVKTGMEVTSTSIGIQKNSRLVSSRHQLAEDRLMLSKIIVPDWRTSRTKAASLQHLETKRPLKSNSLSELLKVDIDSVIHSPQRYTHSSADSGAASPEPELEVEDSIWEKSMRCHTQSRVSFGNLYEVVHEDEEEGLEDTELEIGCTTHNAELAESSFPLPISSPMAESEEDVSQSFLVHSSGKSTPRRRPPKDFVCPITGQLFTDPVTLETGQTYERRAIQEWLGRGNTTCPITRQTLGSTSLPNTNILLKRIIGTWKEQNPELAMEFNFFETPILHTSNSLDANSSNGLCLQGLNSNLTLNPDINGTGVKSQRGFISRVNPISSPTSVISQTILETMMSELIPSVSILFTSKDLQDCESTILTITRVWQACKGEPTIQSLLVRPAIINRFVEILSNSLDLQILKATVYILSELVSANDIVAQILTKADSDFECLVALLKKGLVESATLMYQLKPSSLQLSFHDLVPSLVHIIITNIEKKETRFQMCFRPKKAAIMMLERMLGGGDDSSRLLNALTVISMNGLPALMKSLKSKNIKVRFSALSVLLYCIQANGRCRSLIAHRVGLVPVLELFHTGNDRERSIVIAFISELVRLNRRTFHTQFLQIIKDEGAFSTMHMLLAYLQMAPLEQCPVVASLLLQLDLLAEPCKMSMYREEAIETLVEGLKAKQILISQINSAKTIVALSGRFSLSGKPLTEAWLLRTAGFNKHYNAFMKAEKLLNLEVESPEFLEEEEAAKDWDRRVVSVLVNFEFGSVFEALGECLINNSVELARPCLVAATWLTHMLKVLPDTGVRDVARQCLLEPFVMVLQSSRNLEERILATLALTSFINDSEGLKDLGAYVKGICEPLRQLRKFSSAAADILRSLLSLPFVNISKLCSFAELAQVDSSMNGEVRSLAHFGDRIFSGHSDGTLKVWDGRKMLLRLIQEVQEHTKPIISISISQPGEILHTGSLDKTVRVWAVGLEEIHCIQVHDMKDPIEALYFNIGIAFSITQGTGVKIYNWDGSSKLAIPNKNVKCLAMAEGKVYCGCTDYSIQEIDLNCGTVRTLDSGVRKLLGKNSIYAIQIHGNHLYAGGSVVDGVAAKVWNLSTNTLMGSLSTTAEIRSIAVNNDFIFLGSKSGIIEVWSRERLARIGSLNAGGGGGGGGNTRVICLAVDKDGDGQVLFSGSQDGRIQAWSLT